MKEITSQNRFRGCLLGLAAGDALGTTIEFKRPGSFEPIDDMVGGGPFDLQAGQWTDDTSMALCLASSLLECDDFDPADQMQRYVRWWREGYLSSTGNCFDIGITIRGALSRFMKDGEPFAGATAPNTAGNGSLMRLAPVPMFYAANLGEAVERSAESSLTTHGAVEAVDACRYYGGLLAGAFRGMGRDILLGPAYSPVPHGWEVDPLTPKIKEIALGSYKDKDPPEIKGTGYVAASLEAALWAFHRSTNFRDGALLAVNLGDDADTTGAIYGQLAGAFYGVESIPQSWRDKLTLNAEIESLADQLYQRSVTTRTG